MSKLSLFKLQSELLLTKLYMESTNDKLTATHILHGHPVLNVTAVAVVLVYEQQASSFFLKVCLVLVGGITSDTADDHIPYSHQSSAFSDLPFCTLALSLFGSFKVVCVF